MRGLVISLLAHGGVVAALVVLVPPPQGVDAMQRVVLSVEREVPPAERTLEAPAMEAEAWEPAPEEWTSEPAEEFTAMAEPYLPEISDVHTIPGVRLAHPLISKPAPAVEAATAPAPAVVAPKPRRPVLRPARPIAGRCPPATYPPRARRMGLEGEVVLLILVGRDGSLGEVDIASSSGHASLDRAALAAVQQWHFTPAQRDGRAVPFKIRVPFRFRLQ